MTSWCGLHLRQAHAKQHMQFGHFANPTKEQTAKAWTHIKHHTYRTRLARRLSEFSGGGVTHVAVVAELTALAMCVIDAAQTSATGGGTRTEDIGTSRRKYVPSNKHFSFESTCEFDKFGHKSLTAAFVSRG